MKNLYICPECGSTNIQQRVWAKPNKSYFFADLDDASEECWCEDCQEHYELEAVELKPIKLPVSTNRQVWVDDTVEPEKSGIANFYKHEDQHPTPKALVEIYGSDKLTWHEIDNVYYLPEQLATYGWTCTDPDTFQYCQQLSDTSFRYKEFNRVRYVDDYSQIRKNGAGYNDMFDTGKYWIEEDIVFECLTENEIKNAISGYHDSLDELKEQYGDDWVQIVCECVFEYTNGLY